MLTNTEIEAIRKRAEETTKGNPLKDVYALARMDRVIHEDVPALLAEIDRLRKFEERVTNPITVTGIAEDGSVVEMKNVVFDFSGGDE